MRSVSHAYFGQCATDRQSSGYLSSGWQCKSNPPFGCRLRVQVSSVYPLREHDCCFASCRLENPLLMSESSYGCRIENAHKKHMDMVRGKVPAIISKRGREMELGCRIVNMRAKGDKPDVIGRCLLYAILKATQ